jgi:hypothetical protein
MYQGEVVVSEEELPSFSDTMDALKIKGNKFDVINKQKVDLHLFNNSIFIIF